MSEYAAPAPHLLKFFYPTKQELLPDLVEPIPQKCSKCHRWPKGQVKICGGFGHILCRESCALELVTSNDEQATEWKCPVMKEDQTGFYTNCQGKTNAHKLTFEELKTEDLLWKYRKPVYCPYMSCRKRMQSRDLWEHAHNCLHVQVACPLNPTGHKVPWECLREHLRTIHKVPVVDDSSLKEVNLPVMWRNDEGTVLVFECGKTGTGAVVLGTPLMPPPAVLISHNEKPNISEGEPQIEEEEDYMLITGGTKTPLKSCMYFPDKSSSTKTQFVEVQKNLRRSKKTGKIVLKTNF